MLRKKRVQLVHCSQAHNWERFENRAAGRAKRIATLDRFSGNVTSYTIYIRKIQDT